MSSGGLSPVVGETRERPGRTVAEEDSLRTRSVGEGGGSGA